MTGNAPNRKLPLEGIRVVEFTHMVMGPTCGLILADLGAEVIKIEPLQGDNTRRLIGSGAGFFAMTSRNKKSVAVDVKTPQGREVVLKLAATADVFSENFKAGVMDRLGFGAEALSRLNPRLVYISHKGFLPGPYEHRTALDEVVQMMGGLAYMTGPEGQPLRAGASVNDIMGGMFGAIAAIAALYQRDRTENGSQRGAEIQTGLFENNIYLVAQHMLQYAVTGEPAAPMPSRISAWGVYDVFTVKDDEQIFLAVVSDTQWKIFCDAFNLTELYADASLATNNDRVRARPRLIPILREALGPMSARELARMFEANGLPYAPIAKPHDLYEDPHLLATGGLTPVTIAADASGAGRTIETKQPLLPFLFDGERLPLRSHPPALGAHTRELLAQLGYADQTIDVLAKEGVIVGG